MGAQKRRPCVCCAQLLATKVRTQFAIKDPSDDEIFLACASSDDRSAEAHPHIYVKIAERIAKVKNIPFGSCSDCKRPSGYSTHCFSFAVSQ